MRVLALLMALGPHKDREKTLTRVGIEPMTFGFDHNCSTDWATRSDRRRSWELKMSNMYKYKEGLRFANVGRILEH